MPPAMSRPTNAKPTRAEIVAIRRSTKALALAGDTHAQLAVATFRLADVLERRGVPVPATPAGDEPPRAA